MGFQTIRSIVSMVYRAGRLEFTTGEADSDQAGAKSDRRNTKSPGFLRGACVSGEGAVLAFLAIELRERQLYQLNSPSAAQRRNYALR